MNIIYFSACTGLPSAWVNVQSDPPLSAPVDYDAVLTLSCLDYYTLVGSVTVTCKTGTEFKVPGEEPQCKPGKI